MEESSMRRISVWWCVGVLLGAYSASGAAQTWAPENNVELIVPATAGGSLDATGRMVQKIWSDLKLLPTSSTVVNRSGGGHAVAYNYLNQQAGNPHVMSITSSTILTNHINGRLKVTYTDFTPLAVLLTEHIAITVRPDSPIKSGKDLVEALKKDPTSLSIGLGSAAGGTHHIAIALPLLSGGVDVKKLKLVSFNSSGEAVTALLGGHIDVISAGTINVAPHIQAGKMRAVGTTAPQRLQGVFANVPTWPEQGYKGVFENWRGVVGAKGIKPQQTAYWEGVLKRVVGSDEFKQQAEQNQWEQTFKGSAEMRTFLAAQYADLKAVMTPLGLAK
jgi:putative tricarboxylic transport membrane protein